MNCTQADALIQMGLDGRLSPAERAHLDAHLSQCSACRAAWDEYRRLGQTASDWARPPAITGDPDEAFTAQVMARIAAGQASMPPISSRQILLWSALIVSALSALSFWAAPLLSAFLPSVPFTGRLPSPPDAAALDALWRTLGHVPQDAINAWDTLTTQSVTRSGWAWSALALALGVNVLFAWRTRNQALGTTAG